MVNCWNELAENRPTFPDLVREFDSMISMLSEKVKITVTAPFKASLREIGTNYHNKHFTLRLALKERPRGTGKWSRRSPKNNRAGKFFQARIDISHFVVCQPSINFSAPILFQIGIFPFAFRNTLIFNLHWSVR